MGMQFTGANLTAALERILGCAYDAVSATAAGPPARACVVPGVLVWDDCQCGLLAVTWSAIAASNQIPSTVEASGDPCGPPYVAVQAGVAMLRCASVGDQAPPTCDELVADTLTMTEDAAAIRAAVGCCLRDLAAEFKLADWSLGATTPLGPEGGCAGSALSLTLGFTGGCC